ncbi:MAG: hypothetical protein GY832_24880 [Chloroflexi bacterium]|nr:hypothetical protein [Chloroflexota bacterium]
MKLLQSRFWLLWTFAGFLIMTTTGCMRSNPVVRQVDTSTTTTWPSAIWKDAVATFIDPTLGLAVDVPSDWCIKPRTGAVTDPVPTFLSSPCFNGAPIPLKPCTQVQITTGSSNIHSIDEAKDYIVQRNWVVFKEKQLDLQGFPALWIETEAGETDTSPKFPAIRVFVLTNEYVVVVSAYGELAPVADVVNSIRPIETEESNSP